MQSLTNDGLLAVAEQLGVQTLPSVLSVRSQQDSYTAWHRTRTRARAALQAEGVLNSYGEVDLELADTLFILARPDQELAARRCTGDEIATASVAQRGNRYAMAIRTGDRFDIGPLCGDGTPETLTAPLLSALGASEPARIPGFSAPSVDLAERLNNARHTGEYIDAFYALGLDPQEAVILGAAFGTCRACTEIVAYSHADGRSVRAPGAVAVYDTERGRIVAAPTVSPDHQVWSTVTTGTDHRLTQAVAALLEGLPADRSKLP